MPNDGNEPDPATATLRPSRRFLGALATWAILFLATPGLLTRDGLWWAAFVALVPWALVASRPGKRAFLAEWLAASIGISAICWWSTYVVWITLLAVALVPAVYMAFAGVVLRRIARRWPLALAVPAAWVGLETLRMIVEPPLGFGWMRLGPHAHAQLWLAGSARVWGTAGLSFAMAALAGGIADLVRARGWGGRLGQDRDAGEPTSSERHRDGQRRRGGRKPDEHRSRELGVPPNRGPRFAATVALAPLALAIVLSLVTSAPPMREGPRILLVQPGFEQERKMSPLSADDMLDTLLRLTRAGVARAEAAHERIDIVAWGETCVPTALAAPDAVAAWDRGVRPKPWNAERLTRAWLETLHDRESILVGEILYGANGRPPVLPPRAAFVAGAEQFVADGEVFARENAVVAWTAPGVRTGVGGKVHLVPGGETMSGLESLAWVRDAAYSLAGYVPDLVARDRAEVLAVHGADDREWKVGVSVCFDNAFEGPYLGAGQPDFHLIASNEAWYRESWEYDQMIAFSRMIAIETGRSFVRATNAGITAVIGPDGREVARLTVGGRDRMVAGSLCAVVPVPVDPSVRPAFGDPPLYAKTWRAWLALWVGLALVLALTGRSRPVTAPD